MTHTTKIAMKNSMLLMSAVQSVALSDVAFNGFPPLKAYVI
jgi:hypothetical protein